MLLNFKPSAKANYGWWLVGIGVVVMTLTGNGLVLSLVRILAPALSGGSGALLLWTVTSSRQFSRVLLPIVGLAVDRFGPRPMMLAGLTLCAVAAVAASLLPVGVATLALLPVLTAGTLVGTSTPVLTSINHWFYRRRALAIAVLLFAVDALEFPISLATTDLGTATLIFGVLILVIGLPLATQVRRQEPGVGRVAGDNQPPRDEPGNWDGGYSAPEYRWTEAVRTREFWLLTAAAASLTAVDQLTRWLLFPIADYRFELEGSYRQFEDPYGIVSSVFLLVGGLMAMRMRLRSALLIFAIVHLLAVIIVLLAPNTWWLFVASVILGAGYGGLRALGIAAVGDYFGRNRFATLLGTQGLLIAVAELAMVGGPLLVTKLAENPTWEYAAAIVPAAVGIGAYRMLGDPKHAPSETTLGDAQG